MLISADSVDPYVLVTVMSEETEEYMKQVYSSNSTGVRVRSDTSEASSASVPIVFHPNLGNDDSLVVEATKEGGEELDPENKREDAEWNETIELAIRGPGTNRVFLLVIILVILCLSHFTSLEPMKLLHL